MYFNSDVMWNAVFGDKFGEQTYIRCSKSKRTGQTNSPDQIACWQLLYYICNILTMDNVVCDEDISHIQLLGHDADIFVLLVYFCYKYVSLTLITI